MARGFRGAPGGTRQRKHWVGSDISTLSLTANATFIAAAVAITDPITILRTLGNILVVPTGGGTFASGDSASITFGLGLVITDAFTVGASAVPDAADEADFDWLWWYASLVSFEASVDNPGQEIGLTERIRIESKAMRKVKGHGMSYVLLGQYTNLSGNPPMNVISQFRMLFGE